MIGIDDSTRNQGDDGRRTAGDRGAPWPMPAMYGCPHCGTARVITSPGPLGVCASCGAPNVVLPPG